jgi:preprotein translocase subunit SecD
MTTVTQLLQKADPVRYETPRATDRDRVRQAMLAAVSTSAPGSRPRRLVLAAALGVALIAIAGARWWPSGGTVQAAAVRFEVQLAESTPALGLTPARVAGSDIVIYLHREPVVTNEDIERARVVPGNAPQQFHVAVTLTPSGANKMRAATANHIGRPVALLVDGEVISAPTVRAAVGADGLISGNFTKDEADRIANGMLLR